MRKPRPEDYDPAFKPKGLVPEEIDMTDVVAIKPKSQDLSTSPSPTLSPNDRTVASSERLQQPNDRTVKTTERPNDRTEKRKNERPEQGRRTRRYSYEFFEDQIQAIRRFKAQRELDGERVGYSDIVREAIDLYIATHTQPNDRTVASSERLQQPNDRTEKRST